MSAKPTEFPMVSAPGLREQLHQLDFLLGHTECVGRQLPDGSEPTVMHMYGKPTLGGYYYNVDVDFPGTVRGRWTFGWNPVDGEFNVYYIADSGTQGVASSPGWQDGKFVVTGTYTVAERNAHKTVRDVFTEGDGGRFTTHSFVRSEAGDQWIPLDVFDCRRVGPPQQ